VIRPHQDEVDDEDNSKDISNGGDIEEDDSSGDEVGVTMGP